MLIFADIHNALIILGVVWDYGQAGSWEDYHQTECFLQNKTSLSDLCLP
jgi:hypothetical protein